MLSHCLALLWRRWEEPRLQLQTTSYWRPYLMTPSELSSLASWLPLDPYLLTMTFELPFFRPAHAWIIVAFCGSVSVGKEQIAAMCVFQRDVCLTTKLNVWQRFGSLRKIKEYIRSCLAVRGERRLVRLLSNLMNYVRLKTNWLVGRSKRTNPKPIQICRVQLYTNRYHVCVHVFACLSI